VFELPSRAHGLLIYSNGTRLSYPTDNATRCSTGFAFLGAQMLKSMNIDGIAKSWQDNP